MSAGVDSPPLIQRNLIFITGASRSGTTLLSFVLRNHPEVYGLRELQYFGEAWDPRSGTRHIARPRALAAVAAMLARQEQGLLAARVDEPHRRAAAGLLAGLGPAADDPAAVFAATAHSLAQAAGKSIPAEQTPRYVFYARALLDLYPAAHVVHMLRDPRAVMASQKMRWRRRQLAADGAAVPRYQSLRTWVNYHPYTVARLWTQATSAALALVSHPRVTLLRFEDLVQQPEGTVRALCDRLGLDYDARMLDVGQVNSSHQSAAGGARRGLHATAIDQWRKILTPTEVAIAERDCARLMARCGYESSRAAAPGLAAELGQRMTYLAHLGGVLLVNPRRAWVQARAVLRPRRSVATDPGATATANGDSPR